jgi:hypothetical protein
MANGYDVTKLDHVAEPVKATVRDLLKVCENVTKLMDNSSGQNADVRVLKKRFDQMKTELYQSERKFEKAQALILSLLEDIQDVTNSLELIVKTSASQSNVNISQEARKAQALVQKQASKIMQFQP